METISYTLPPEQAGATVRHILRAQLHFSSHAVSRLAHAENGIRVNGVHARTTRVLRPGDVLTVEPGDHRPPKAEVIPGNWPLPVVWEDGHLLVVDKPAGMAAHASSFLPDTPTVAGALAWQRGGDFIFHPVNRLDKGTTGLMAVAKSGYVHDLLRRQLHTPDFRREYRAVCLGCPLAGDWLYGTEDPALIPRPALHSCALALTHPVTGERLRLTAPVPPDLARLVPPPEDDRPSIF